MLYSSLIRRAEELSSRSAFELPPIDQWQAQLPERRRQWHEMLGLDPLPERTDLCVTHTGELDRGHYVVEKLHFQPLPDCRIPANLYRPKQIRDPLPGVVYVCGHSQRGKFHYQPHPRWFGEHGYVSIVLDPIQVGEGGGVHHGVVRHDWWHWMSQGYTPAGIEVWAAMRALDYLETRDDVDPSRFGITGLSGGGTMSWFAGAADGRFQVVVPACQTGTMEQHVHDRTIDGHCDCTFWNNTYGWDFPDVACLIAPRALLVAASTEDVLFRPYAFRDLVHRARMLYRAYGCEERVGLVEDVNPHGYTPKTRLAIFNWFERHLKGSSEAVTEDLHEDQEDDRDLAVYPDMKPPADDKMHEADRHLIPLPPAPAVGSRSEWETHQAAAIAKLRAQTFRTVPDPVPAPHARARRDGQSAAVQYRTYEFETEPGLLIRARLMIPVEGPRPYPVLVGPVHEDASTGYCGRGASVSARPGVAGAGTVEVRGTGCTSIGPGLLKTVRRAYALLGQTLPERQTFDLLRGMAVLRRETNVGPVVAFGRGRQAALAIYAAVLDPTIAEVVLQEPVASHWGGGPEFLNALKVGDLAHNLTLVFPRPITFVGPRPDEYAWTEDLYRRGGAGERVRTVAELSEWKPLG